MASVNGVRRLRSPARNISHKVIGLEVKAVNAFVPRRLLLFYVNLLDRRVPPKVKTSIVDGIGKLPEDVRASLLVVADEYVPQDVDNSWKFCAVVAGICQVHTGEDNPDAVRRNVGDAPGEISHPHSH